MFNCALPPTMGTVANATAPSKKVIVPVAAGLTVAVNVIGNPRPEGFGFEVRPTVVTDSTATFVGTVSSSSVALTVAVPSAAGWYVEVAAPPDVGAVGGIIVPFVAANETFTPFGKPATAAPF